jgi:putative ABC transport system substrate-binding protein
MCAMRKAGLLSILFVVVLLAVAVVAETQQPNKVPRIGYLGANRTNRTEAFRQGLRELGYIEQKNIVIEYRFAKGELNRLSDLLLI